MDALLKLLSPNSLFDWDQVWEKWLTEGHSELVIKAKTRTRVACFISFIFLFSPPPLTDICWRIYWRQLRREWKSFCPVFQYSGKGIFSSAHIGLFNWITIPDLPSSKRCYSGAVGVRQAWADVLAPSWPLHVLSQVTELIETSATPLLSLQKPPTHCEMYRRRRFCHDERHTVASHHRVGCALIHWGSGELTSFCSARPSAGLEFPEYIISLSGIVRLKKKTQLFFLSSLVAACDFSNNISSVTFLKSL